RVPNPDMPFNLRENAAGLEPLHEVFGIRRMQIERRPGLERAVNGAKDAQQLIVVEMLREIERERRVEPIRMLGAKRDDVSAVKRTVADAETIPPLLRRPHESV